MTKINFDQKAWDRIERLHAPTLRERISQPVTAADHSLAYAALCVAAFVFVLVLAI